VRQHVPFMPLTDNIYSVFGLLFSNRPSRRLETVIQDTGINTEEHFTEPGAESGRRQFSAWVAPWLDGMLWFTRLTFNFNCLLRGNLLSLLENGMIHLISSTSLSDYEYSYLGKKRRADGARPEAHNGQLYYSTVNTLVVYCTVLYVLYVWS
jgi:hypothetical protein